VSGPRPIPYPADTRAKGWRFELDLERVMQSDTWALASPDNRPWLLMLWAVAWQQVPCGSMPSDEALIAARLGMKTATFKKVKDVLMRGWWKADDGRLYHDTIIERVADMMGRKEGERKRKAEYRARMDAERKTAESAGVPRMSHGTDMGQTRDSMGTDAGRTWESGGRDATGTGTGTSTGLNTKNLSVPKGTDAEASPEGMSAKEAIFHVAVPWLVEHGVPDKNARSLLGGAVKQLGDDGAWSLAQECLKEAPISPAAWLATAINARMPAGKGKGKQSRHSGFDGIDYREGVNDDGSF
jgi:hypothetical protein